MKRVLCLVLLFAILFSIIPISVLAESDVPGMDEAPLVGKIQEGHDALQNEENPTDYLKQEWRKILANNPKTAGLMAFLDFFEVFNPFFKAILGVEYSLSWAFILAVMIWFTLFFFFFQPAKALFGNPFFGLVGAFIFASLVGLSGVIRMAVDMISKVVSTWWLALIVLGVTLIIGAVIVKLGGGLKKMIEEGKEKAAKEQLEKDRTVIHTDAEVSQKKLEGYKDQGGGI